jgi:hypothetical protein
MQWARTQLVLVLLVHAQVERVVPHVVVNSSLLGVADHGVGLSKRGKCQRHRTGKVSFAGVAEIYLGQELEHLC